VKSVNLRLNGSNLFLQFCGKDILIALFILILRGLCKFSFGEGRNLEIASRKALEELDKQTWRRKESKDGSKRS